MRRVFQKLKHRRAVPLLVVSIMVISSAVVMGVGASAAQALTHEGAEEVSLKYAKERWGGDAILEACYNTGVNEANHVQWECYGYLGGELCTGWYVGVGPYGGILEAERYDRCALSATSRSSSAGRRALARA